MERTLVMIKPDNVDEVDHILDELKSCGRLVRSIDVPKVPFGVIAEHYHHHRDTFYFKWLMKQFVGNEVILGVYEGVGVIHKVRNKVGHLDPTQAVQGTIRREYSDDSLERSRAEHRAIRNVIHASDSLEEAQREIRVWERYLNLST